MLIRSLYNDPPSRVADEFAADPGLLQFRIKEQFNTKSKPIVTDEKRMGAINEYIRIGLALLASRLIV
ncbi:MAG TPA: hypothetical protein VIZ28_00585 [Chitinophagaceae bacterium]